MRRRENRLRRAPQCGQDLELREGKLELRQDPTGLGLQEVREALVTTEMRISGAAASGQFLSTGSIHRRVGVKLVPILSGMFILLEGKFGVTRSDE